MKSEKQLLKQEIKDKIDNSDSFVIMQYSGLTAGIAHEFRREMGKIGGDVEIVRKRVLLKAAQDSGLGLDISWLDGHIGLVLLGKDPFEGTKALFKFSQEHDNIFSVKGGRFDGRLYRGEEIKQISQLPGKNEMRAQLLGLFDAPIAQTLAVMEAALASVIYCLDNKSKQEENPS